MANTPLSDLNPGNALSLADTFYVVQGGNSRRVTAQQLKNMFGGGWTKIVDAATAGEADAKAYSSGVRTQLTLDGGLGTILTYGDTVGTDLSDWWAANKQVGHIEGECYTYRLSFNIKKSSVSTDQQLLMEMDIGGALGVIVSCSETLIKASGVEQNIKFAWSGYALDTFLANGAAFYLTADADVEIWNPQLFIQRTYVPTPPT